MEQSLEQHLKKGFKTGFEEQKLVLVSLRMPTLQAMEVDASSHEEESLTSQQRDTIRHRWCRDRTCQVKHAAHLRTFRKPRKSSSGKRTKTSSSTARLKMPHTVLGYSVFVTFEEDAEEVAVATLEDVANFEDDSLEDDSLEDDSLSLSSLLTQGNEEQDDDRDDNNNQRDQDADQDADDSDDEGMRDEEATETPLEMDFELFGAGAGFSSDLSDTGPMEQAPRRKSTRLQSQATTSYREATTSYREASEAIEELSAHTISIAREEMMNEEMMSEEKEMSEESEGSEKKESEKNEPTREKKTKTSPKVTKKAAAARPKKNAKAKTTIKLVEDQIAYLVDVQHWMSLTVAIMEKAEMKLTAPRRTWASEFESLRSEEMMLYTWFTCCGMLASPRNKDENVTRFMNLMRSNNYTPDGMRKLIAEKGSPFVEGMVAKFAIGGFNLKAASFVMKLLVEFEDKKLWLARWEDIQIQVEGIGSKCAIILYEMWHPGECPGIAVDVHVLTLGKALGIFHYDCGDQDLVQQTLQAIIPQAEWPEINMHFGSLFQFLHGSRGGEARRKLFDAARSVGPAASTMLKLFDSTKKLVGVGGLKKTLSTITATLKSSYEEGATAII